MNYADADKLLEVAEGNLAVARELMGDRKTHKVVSQQLSGILAAVETVRLWLGQAGKVKQCPKHSEYEDSCHDCYILQYGRQKGNP